MEIKDILPKIISWRCWKDVEELYKIQNNIECDIVLIRETRRFLALKVILNGQEIIPPPKINTIWQIMMSMPKKYIEFCNLATDSNVIIDNDPLYISSNENARRRCYRAAYESYTEKFGKEPPSDFWPAPEDTCYGIFIRCLNGKLYPIVSESSDTIFNIKEKLAEIIGGTPCGIRLKYRNRQLENDMQRCMYNICNGEILEATPILRGC